MSQPADLQAFVIEVAAAARDYVSETLRETVDVVLIVKRRTPNEDVIGGTNLTSVQAHECMATIADVFLAAAHAERRQKVGG